MREHRDRRVAYDLAGRDDAVRVLGILFQRAEIQHGLQPAGRSELRAQIGGNVPVAAAIVSHGGLAGHRARAGVDAEIVIEDEIVVGVVVSLIKLLRGGDDVDLLGPAKAFSDR